MASKPPADAGGKDLGDMETDGARKGIDVSVRVPVSGNPGGIVLLLLLTRRGRGTIGGDDCLAVRALATQYNGLVVLPILRVVFEATVAGEEEEVDCANDEHEEEQGEEGKVPLVVD